MNQKKGFINVLQEFSIPLIAGVLCALVYANLDPAHYHSIVDWMPFGHVEVFGHELTLHWLVNDVFMVFFFGIAAKEITESILPGGALNPIGKAINPLLATLGGVVGPVCVFFLALHFALAHDLFPGFEAGVLRRGWGVPTATDIALAWLVARTVFGPGHPAVNFLLLLAVADDAIGLAIIAVFYGDPAHPTEVDWLLLVGVGMAVAFVLRRLNVKPWQPYIFVAGPIAWAGLVLARLHPALALVFIVPFLPGPKRDTGMFEDSEDLDGDPERGLVGDGAGGHLEHSTLHAFEHQMKLFVDLGLFFFAFTNAGVEFKEIGWMTWIILGSLIVGKTVGITAFGVLGKLLGFPLPARMGMKELVMAGFVASLGLTVALFVCAQAFPAATQPLLLGEAKMGALFTGFVGLIAIPLGRMLRIRS